MALVCAHLKALRLASSKGGKRTPVEAVGPSASSTGTGRNLDQIFYSTRWESLSIQLVKLE